MSSGSRDNTDDGGRLRQLMATASYVEQVLTSEAQWIWNRLSWLFVSQSFCITAYAVLITSKDSRFPGGLDIEWLRVALPLFGVLSCICVGLAVHAAGREGRALADERARLSRLINEATGQQLPIIGVSRGMRDRMWTKRLGSLPQHVLPWSLLALWLVLLVLVLLPFQKNSAAPSPAGRYQLVTATGSSGSRVWLVDTATGEVIPEDKLEYGKPRAIGK